MQRAVNKTVGGEFFERAAMIFIDEEKVQVHSPSQLSRRGGVDYYDFIDLLRRGGFLSSRELSREDESALWDADVPWVEGGERLVSGRRVLVPLFMVSFVPLTVMDDVLGTGGVGRVLGGKYDVRTTSNGTAAGFDREYAAARSLLELLERDVAMDWWLFNRRPDEVIKYVNGLRIPQYMSASSTSTAG